MSNNGVLCIAMKSTLIKAFCLSKMVLFMTVSNALGLLMHEDRMFPRQ